VINKFNLEFHLTFKNFQYNTTYIFGLDQLEISKNNGPVWYSYVAYGDKRFTEKLHK